MDWIAGAVLGASLVATAWLIYYVRWYLPAQYEERMRQSLKAFGTAVELRFPSHEGFSTRVLALSDTLGKKMGLSRAQLQRLEMAGRLRDIGLCAIPYSLVNGKPFGMWTQAEMATYLRHAEVSAAMLELVPTLSHLSQIVRYHHTRYAGPEEPGTPRGDEIPVEARILRVVCEFVWLERWYGVLAARSALLAGRGTAFCPRCVDQLLGVLTSIRVEEHREPVAV